MVDVMLSEHEALVLRRLVKIMRARDRIYSWRESVLDDIDDTPDDIISQWARKNFDLICLKEAEREIFDFNRIDNKQVRERVRELIGE